MTLLELKKLKHEIRTAIIDANNSGKFTRVQQLKEAKRKINEKIKTANLSRP